MDLRPDSLNCISVCAGGGGLDLGVELAIPCARPILYVEREAFACGHLVEAIEGGLLAPAPVWTDARTVPGRRFRGCVDFVFGGIPCQPHSVAGKQLGEEDERDLWSPTRRLVVQSGAWVVLIENVGGMLSTGGAYRVWRDLQRLGFEVEGGLFTAEEVGAPHQRERIFILGVADARSGMLWDDGRAEPVGEASALPGEVRKQRLRPDAPSSCDGGDAELADSGRGRQRREGHALHPPGSLLAAGGVNLGVVQDDAQGERRREGRAQSELQRRRDAPPGADGAVVDASRGGRAGRTQDPIGRALDGTPAEWSGERPVFPPGPRDADAWRATLERWPEVEPAVRGMAHGLAAGMDLAGLDRIDRLRLLGNGVVSLEGAYALRTLATRLAARSAGAAHLVRLMEES